MDRDAIRRAILEADDLPREKVELGPPYHCAVWIRALAGHERDLLEAERFAARDGPPTVQLANIRARMVARCAVDERGERVFADEDVAALGRKNAAMLDRLWTVAVRLNALSAADVEELEKNSGSGPSAASGSS